MKQLNSHKQERNIMNRSGMLTLIATAVVCFLIVLPATNATGQPAKDIEEVRAASKAFYAALSVLDNGEAMDKVWAHMPYITFVGPRSKSVIVGWESLKKYWQENNKLFSQRDTILLDQQIHVNGNLAWEMGRETGTVKMANGSTRNITLMVTNVYEKIDGRWLIVSHHAQPTPK